MPERANMLSSGTPMSFTRLMITCWIAELTPKSPQPRHHQAPSPVISARFSGISAVCNAISGPFHSIDNESRRHQPAVVAQNRVKLSGHGARRLALDKTSELCSRRVFRHVDSVATINEAADLVAWKRPHCPQLEIFRLHPTGAQSLDRLEHRSVNASVGDDADLGVVVAVVPRLGKLRVLLDQRGALHEPL